MQTSADAGVAWDAAFRPAIAVGGDGCATVSLERRLPDGGHAVIWSHACDAMEGRAMAEWMSLHPRLWERWGRIGVRLGADAIGPLIVTGAMQAAAREAEVERERLAQEAERARLATEITLYTFNPKKGPPALGFERGCDDETFWRMRFDEKWERDRVVDYLRRQKPRFIELEAYWREHGDLELERLVLSEMRAAEQRAKKLGIAAGGRRPLRFWRGEQ